MKKVLLKVVALMFLSVSVWAQKKISGKVTDKNGNPVEGASVLVKGTKVGTTTDTNGNYTLTAPEGSKILIVSSVGHEQMEMAIGTGNTVSFTLNQSVGRSEDVVVVGYATQKRKEFSGSAAIVKGSAIAEKPVQSFAQGLTGQASGVNIIQPNGLLNNPPVIRVRGLSSISLSSFPLVVVDGIPISTGDVSTSAVTNNPLSDINPADIESIDILKDAASASIYGSRAAAGVLLITTKKGKSGRTTVNYDGWLGQTQAVRLPKMLNAQQYVTHKNAAIANALSVNPNFSAAPRDAFAMMNDDKGNPVDVNWQDVVYRSAISHNHNLTFSGGNDKTNFYLSAGFSDQEGFLKANTFERRSVRVNINHKLTDKIKLFTVVNYTNGINNAPNSGSYAGGAFASSGLGRIANAQAPNVPIYNANGTLNIEAGAIGRGANKISLQFVNPIPLIEQDKNRSETNRIFANLGTDIQIVDGLSFRTSYTWDLRLTDNQRFWNPVQGDGYASTGQAYNNSARSDNWNWTNILQYQKTFKDAHNLTILAGNDVQKTRTDNWGGNRDFLADPFFSQFQGTFINNTPGGNGISEISFEAYLASLSYNFKNKYYFSANVRRDGNSALSTDNRWGTFGGASVGWTLSNENFFQNSSLSNVFNNLKLKASWGKTGNGNLANYYGAYNLYDATIYGTSAGAVFYAQAGNDKLKWETSKQTNIGLELGIIKGRLNFEMNWFNKDINNMILAVPQAPSKGVPGNTILFNVGSMYNKGLDFTINMVPVQKGDFKWNTNINFTTIKNKVTALVSNNTPILGYTSSLELSSITEVGASASSIFGVQSNGVNPENGRRIFIDNQGRQVQYQHQGGADAWTLLDGTRVSSGSVTSAAKNLGNTQPTWFGGFNNTLTYKSFDLGLNITFSGGNYIYNGSRAGLLDQRVWNNSTEILGAWSPQNKNSKIPRPIYTDNISNGSAFLISDNVEKGDFLRFQNVVLGYSVPKSTLGNSAIKNVRLYLQASNLFLITGYSGVDPEISSNGNSNISSGIERNSIPQGRTLTVGVNIGF
ncbi:SusC/RagA family TonB-linked outer membrane protein [Polluticaenibacter yanchengensis]|uniref:TonB-dependent receptor n=1 Tax=Polluticaenibacter yanchengensis TaxID=3014562 RepID=A0ABT4UGT9_9BACT|nr:TonB-dependent receptor [Chitinophagaceae bacterium LY-5]